MSKKDEMFALVEQWRESGMTRKSFANQHGFKSESFYYWCRKQYNEVVKINRSIKKPIHSSPTSMPNFVEVTCDLDENAHKQSILMELELPGGIRIKIY